MGDIAIKVENLSKLYQLGEVGTGTISHDLNRWWARMRRKEDPYAKVGRTNDRTKKSDSDFVWALKDINFEVKRGDVLGIIGRNGAGKSTLLKILSKITSPTTGKIYTKGKIASLLEVGTGFHPEMTGRENIYLNGAILGMRKWEIDKKFDAIVDFAGVESYIDTPVKRYSSGMYVRLAFSVAAYLETDILVLDEVLAVGDFEFQQKCLNKIGDVTSNFGRTVLFVSHNIRAIQTFCNNAILLNQGKLQIVDSTKNVLDIYENKVNNFQKIKTSDYRRNNSELIFIDDIFINDMNLKDGAIEIMASELITIKILIKSKISFKSIFFKLVFYNENYHPISVLKDFISNIDFNHTLSSFFELKVILHKNIFMPSFYYASFGIADSPTTKSLDVLENIPMFIILNKNSLYQFENLKDVNIDLKNLSTIIHQNYD